MNSSTIILNGTPIHFTNAAMAWWQSRPQDDYRMWEEFTDAETIVNPRTGRLIDDLFRYETIEKRNPAHTRLIVQRQTEEAGSVTIERLAVDAREVGPGRTNAMPQTDHWDAFRGIWEELSAALATAGLVTTKTLDELLSDVSHRFSRESKAWWREVGIWYWSGGRDSIKSQADLAEKLEVPEDTLSRRLRDCKPAAEK